MYTYSFTFLSSLTHTHAHTHTHSLTQAGELFISSDMIKEGIDMFISGEEWEKARHVAKTIAPRYGNFTLLLMLYPYLPPSLPLSLSFSPSLSPLSLGLSSMLKKLILIS